MVIKRPPSANTSYWENAGATARANTKANVGKVAPVKTPETRAFTRAAGDLVNQYSALAKQGKASPITYDAAKGVVASRLAGFPTTPAVAPAQNNTGLGTGRSGGGRGGGGGGGGVNPAIAAQSQMDYLTQLLSGKSYTASPMTAQRTALDNLRGTVATASAADQAAATGAYNGLDTYLQGHQTNPYADVKLNRANVSPGYNPYLESQGVQGLNPVTTNPDDSYGAFQNVLALLGANQQSSNQSRLAESQMARTFAGQQIGAMDNAYLANITGQESGIATQEMQRQDALDQEKRAAAMQLAALIAQGAKAPDMAALGLA